MRTILRGCFFEQIFGGFLFILERLVFGRWHGVAILFVVLVAQAHKAPSSRDDLRDRLQIERQEREERRSQYFY